MKNYYFTHDYGAIRFDSVVCTIMHPSQTRRQVVIKDSDIFILLTKHDVDDFFKEFREFCENKEKAKRFLLF